jgi:hypothetical protein
LLVLNIFIATNDTGAGDNCALSNPLIYQPTFGIIPDSQTTLVCIEVPRMDTLYGKKGMKYES